MTDPKLPDGQSATLDFCINDGSVVVSFNAATIREQFSKGVDYKRGIKPGEYIEPSILAKARCLQALWSDAKDVSLDEIIHLLRKACEKPDAPN
jgi:hypothetical protein